MKLNFQIKKQLNFNQILQINPCSLDQRKFNDPANELL